VSAGPSWEVHGHWKDEWNSDPTKICTDVFYLVAPGGAAAEPAPPWPFQIGAKVPLQRFLKVSSLLALPRPEQL
jgi:hypothetical protein